MFLIGLTRLALAEIEQVKTDASGTLILQPPLPLEPGILDLGLRLCISRVVVGKLNDMGDGRVGKGEGEDK
jgi:hypothetical protein